LIDEALLRLGWTEHFERAYQHYLDDGLEPARVAAQHKGSYVVLTAAGELRAEVSGRLRHLALHQSELPVVGDWVIVHRLPGENKALVHGLLPRATTFARKVAGVVTEQQVLAANVDVYFLVSALDQQFNARRMERYLTMAWDGAGTPVIVLTKADLCDDIESVLVAARAVAPEIDIHITSVASGAGVSDLSTSLLPHRTGVFIGPSGVGKSSLVNHLVGHEKLRTKSIREDGRGRHTTTHRELVALPAGGLVIDSPGIRELQLWDTSSGVDDTFADIRDLAGGCRFSDCAHDREPGCAVGAAVDDGRLLPTRFESYRKLTRELAWLERKRDKRRASEESRRWRKLSAEAKARARLR
jgi:ribosome biogenesis GTPase